MVKKGYKIFGIKKKLISIFAIMGIFTLSACDIPIGESPAVLAPSSLTDGGKWQFSIEKTQMFILDSVGANIILYVEDNGVKTKLGSTELDVSHTTGTINGEYKNKKIQAACRTDMSGADTCTVYVEGRKVARLHV